MKKSVIISCAGLGSRIGLGIPKCLINVVGKTIIERQLEQIHNKVDEIIIVVGFKADLVIEFVKSLNYKNVRFALNDNFENTGTGASFFLGAMKAKNDFIIALDGDILVHPEDMKLVLDQHDEFVCGEKPCTEEPMYMKVNNKKMATGFNLESGELEWSGLAAIYKKNIKPDKWFVCDIMNEILPVKAITIRAREIDTKKDFEEAERWIKNNYDDCDVVDNFFKNRFYIDDNYIVSRYSSNDRDKFDIELISRYLNSSSKVLDLGCGTGILEKGLYTKVDSILGIDKYQEFLDRAFKSSNIKYLACSLVDLNIDDEFDVILLFGVSMYLSDDELDKVLDIVYKLMNKESVFIIKNQWGLYDDVIVNKYSENLNDIYFAKYRSIENINRILNHKGFVGDTIDLYPKEYSKWSNTKELAIVIRKK